MTNRETEKARHAAYRVANLEKELARNKKYREENKARRKSVLKAASSRWRSANMGKALEYTRRAIRELRDGYVAARLGVPLRDVPKELLEAKRVELKLKRLIKEMQSEIND